MKIHCIQLIYGAFFLDNSFLIIQLKANKVHCQVGNLKKETFFCIYSYSEFH